MKTLVLFILCTSLTQNKCFAYQPDTLLNNIEQNVLNAFIEGKIFQSDTLMISIEHSLQDLYEKTGNNIPLYWYAYTCYYHSILGMILNDIRLTERTLKAGIHKLETLNHPTSEHLALLALMESLSIQYASGVEEIVSISNSVNRHAQEAVNMDSTNIRAFYVLGTIDIYTPEQYGGGKKAEEFLRKAISLPEQSVKNPYLPSWGKNSAYELLIRLYINRGQTDQARILYQQAISLFPDDYMIKQLSDEVNPHQND